MNTVSTYMRMLRAIYRATKEKRINVDELFDTVYTGVRADTKRSLTAKHMGNILWPQQSPLTKGSLLVMVHSLFLLRGMPFIDLARLKCDLYGDTLIYKRQRPNNHRKCNPGSHAINKQLANRNPQSPYLSILPSNSKLQNGNCFGSKRIPTVSSHIARFQ